MKDRHGRLAPGLFARYSFLLINFFFILITCTVHLLLFCPMTNKCTIISQIITLLLHVSTLLCHPQEFVISTLPSYTSLSNAVVGNII